VAEAPSPAQPSTPGPPPAQAKAPQSSGYLVSPIFDCLNFLYMPLIALALGVGISHWSLARTPVWVMDRPMFPSNLFIGTFIAAHLVLVLVRSHGNSEVFQRHRWRFTYLPVILFLALYSSLWLSVFVSVLAVWWDLYHSSMQTFGLGRLYERKAGNDVEVGRSLDKWLNILLYAGPILGGATLINHLKFFDKFERVGSPWFAAIPAKVQSFHSELTYLMLGVGIPFLLYYVYSYWRLAQQGHRVSYQKVFLLVSTGLTSIYTWGFNSFGQAFFIMNFFHAWQYFAIVWWVEGGNVAGILRVKERSFGKPLALGLFVALPLAYGALVTVVPLNTNNALFCFAMVITIMHFWYDGFIWSVRKKHV
jgi:hypothetical protein